MINFNEFDKIELIEESEIINSISHKYTCVEKELSLAIEHALKKGIPLNFVKYGVGILGRESDYGKVMGKYGVKAVPEYVINSAMENIPGVKKLITFAAKKIMGKDNWVPSMGIAQMTPDVAKKYNVDLNSLMTLTGSLYATCRYLMDLYKETKNYYDEESPSFIIYKNKLIQNPSSTGNGAMDAAIMSYNLGAGKFKKDYCQTSNPGYAAPCNCTNSIYKPFPKDNPEFKLNVFKDKKIKNYIPTIKTSTKGPGKKLLDKMGIETKEEYISSTGYLKEVVERTKKMTCLK